MYVAPVRHAYERLFCAFYRWSERINGKADSNLFYASLMLGQALFFNAASIVVILDIVLDRPLLSAIPEASSVALAPLLIVYFWLHYSYFKRANKYQCVLNAHGSSNFMFGMTPDLFGIIYGVVSMLIFLVLLFVVFL